MLPIPQMVEENKLLEGKNAIITGGSGGIGFSIADTFIKCGCNVVLTGTNTHKLERCSRQLGDKAKYIQLDLTRPSTFSDKVCEAPNLFGAIDILVNSAGVFSTKNPFIRVDEEEYDSIMNINLKGTYFFTQAVANHMITNKIKGHILMISSQSALEPAWSPYRLSKCGLNGITKGIAQQLLPYGIVVNGIGPGPTATPMQDYKQGMPIDTYSNPVGRFTMPEEIAEFAKHLVSDMGNMVIGDTIYLSGGRGIID